MTSGAAAPIVNESQCPVPGEFRQSLHFFERYFNLTVNEENRGDC
jgi:hypothetical protein